jgi:hypothetical protein
MTPSFNSEAKTEKAAGPRVKEKTDNKGRGIDRRVKKFAFIGLAIVIFSILYEYNFNLGAVIAQARFCLNVIKLGKFIPGELGQKKDKMKEKIELLDVRSFQGAGGVTRYAGLKVEGIAYDPDGRSFVTINGTVLSEGESIKQVTVKKINRDTVEVIVDGESKIFAIEQSIPLPAKK